MLRNHAFFVFSVFFVLLLLSGIPFWEMPAGFDAHRYIQMVDSLSSDPVQEISPHHWQRLLPPLMVRFFASLFASSSSLLIIKKSFYVLTYLSFYLFACKLYYFIKDKIRDPLLPISLTFIIIFISWTMVYPLGNIYQLCDLLCMLLTLLFIETLIKKNYLYFVLLGIPAIFIRQNLIILVAFGQIYFLFDFYQNFQRNINQTKEKPKLLIPLIPFALGGFIHLALFILLFSLSPIGKTLQYFLLIPTLNEWGPIKSIYKMISPFLMIIIFKSKELTALTKKYFPITLFMMMTIYQPFAGWSYTGLDNLERIIMQGLWIFNLMGAIFLGRIVKESSSKICYLLTLISPLILGTSHLQSFFSFTFKPLFFLPTHFKNNLIIYLTLIFILCIIQISSTTQPQR